MLGAKGIALLGVLILSIAAALFFKEAWDRGWIATISPAIRCAAGAAFGILLLIIGEILRRRVNALASSGASAAGIAIIYASILAAAQLYSLIATPTAFALLALTTLTGIALGAIASRVLLAAFSLIGAFLIPIVLGSDEPSKHILPAYLVALLALGLALAAWKGNAYSIIRRIAWWGTASLGTLWALSIHQEAPASVLAFLAAVWAMTIAELIASARFLHRFRPATAWPDDNPRIGFLRSPTADEIEFDARSLMTPQARWVNSSFGVTLWSVLIATHVANHWNTALDWTPAAILTALTAAIAIIISPHRPAPWVDTATPRSILATALIINAAALLALTIATALGGAAQVVAWATIGLAAVVFARAVRFNAANIFGLTLIAIALARLITLDLPEAAGIVGPERQIPIATLLGINITRWSVQVALLTAALIAAAALQRRPLYQAIVSWIAIAAAALAMLGPGSQPISVGVAWIAIATIVAALASTLRRPELRIAAPILAATATAIALAASTTDANTAARNALGLAWSDWSTAMAIIAIAWLAIGRMVARSDLQRAAAAATALIAFAAALAGDDSDPHTIILGAALLAAATAALAPWITRWLLAPLALAAAIATACAWAIARVEHPQPPGSLQPLLNFPFAAGTLLTLTGIAIAWLIAHAPQRTPLPNALPRTTIKRTAAWFAALTALVVTSAELIDIIARALPADRSAQGAALSIWWSFYAVAAIIAGFARNAPTVRRAGLALLAFVAAKVLLIDLATLTPMPRIVASAVVGIVLLAAGVLYARLSRDTPPQQHPDPPADPLTTPDPTPDPDPELESEPETEPETRP
ncbi:MAG: DUF2339 domain-containing protein [Phycisphaerales bacterium]